MNEDCLRNPVFGAGKSLFLFVFWNVQKHNSYVDITSSVCGLYVNEWKLGVMMRWVFLIYQLTCYFNACVRDVSKWGTSFLWASIVSLSLVCTIAETGQGEIMGETQKAACCIDCVWVVNRGPLGSMFRVIRWWCRQRVACSTSHLLHADLLVWLQSDKADCLSFKWQKKPDVSEMVVCAVFLNLGVCNSDEHSCIMYAGNGTS